MLAKTVEISFEKLRMAARFWLLGMANYDDTYYNVIDAMEYALNKHTGQRNGGDPEAIHQLRIFHGLRTLHNHLTTPHIKYSAAFLHDVVEESICWLNSMLRIRKNYEYLCKAFQYGRTWI